MEGAFSAVPSIASIPRFAQNPRASPSAFAMLCAKPLGVQLLNCIPLPTFSDTLRYSIKKSQVLCLLPPGFAAIRINFIAASKKNAPSRGESLWAVRSSFLLFKFFYLSNQAAQTVKTAVHSGAPPHAPPVLPPWTAGTTTPPPDHGLVSQPRTRRRETHSALYSKPQFKAASI